MLPIVIHGVHAEVAGNLAGEQALEVLKRQPQRIEGLFRPRWTIEVLDRGEHRLGRAHLHGIGNVEIASPGVHHSGL